MEENFAPHAASETIASPDATAVQPVEQPTVYKESNPSIGTPVGLMMFTVMYFITFGIYVLFWGYYNCRTLSLPSRNKIGNFIYSLFLPISLHEILKRIETKTVEANHPIKMYAIPCGIAYFLLMAGTKFLPDWLSTASALAAFGMLLFIQKRINHVNRTLHPYAWGLKPYNTAQKVLMSVFGVIIMGYFGMMIYGLSDPEIRKEAGLDAEKSAPTNPLMFKTIPAIKSK